MAAAARAWRYARVLWELMRYDVLFACRGLRGVRSGDAGRLSVPRAGSVEVESAIREAVAAVAPFYWKPVRCLQRSVVTARLMRSRGIPAEVVIGYRAAPFFSHAWVEVGGRMVSDSPVYQKRLRVLERL
jgi:hypothetical protein